MHLFFLFFFFWGGGLKTGSDCSILSMVVGRNHIRQSTYQGGGKSNEILNSCVFVLLYLLT